MAEHEDQNARTNQATDPKGSRGLGYSDVPSHQESENDGDWRLAGLQRAIQEGKSEQVLRSFGIISEADLQREFQGTEK